MNVYSPSQTQLYARCPMKWWLQRRQGMRHKVIRNGDLAGAVGIGFAEAMDAYYKFGDVDAAIAAGRTTATAKLDELFEAGCSIRDARLHTTVDLVPERVETAVRAWTKHDHLAGWEKFLTEVPMPQHGNSRPDLIGTDEDDLVTVLDFKTKVTARDWVVSAFLAEQEYSWQMYHYVWAISDVLKEDVEQFAIALIVIEPKPVVHLRRYTVNRDYLFDWERSARMYWAEMTAYIEGEYDTPPMSPQHVDPWGRCEYWDHCLECLPHEYVQLEVRP